MSDEAKPAETAERGGIYWAYCDIKGHKLGGATTDRAEAERRAAEHERETNHATSVITM